MKCSKCGAELSEGEKFCAACGTKVEAAKFCAACGAKLKAGAAFCTECGAKAGEEQASPAQEQKEQSAPPPVPPQSAPATRAPRAADNSSKWLTIKACFVTECDKSAKGHIVIPDGVTRIWGHGSEAWDGWFDDDEWEEPGIFDAADDKDGVYDDGFGGFGAFEGCTLITSITIPDGVTEIGSRAFKGCTSLASVTIPKGIPGIDRNTFEGCTSLESVEFGGTMAEWEKVYGKYYFLKNIPAKSVKCADGEWKRPSILVEHGEVVECLDKTVTSIIIPDSVTEIERGAFRGCESLESVEFGGRMAEWEKVYGKYYFLKNIPAKSVKCADSEWKRPSILVEHGEVVECLDKTVTSIVIPDGVTRIRYGAFKGCTSLASVTIPDSVTEIDNAAFKGCTSLASVTIPDGVTEIGDYGCSSVFGAFEGCTSLASVTIPDSVTKIAHEAFKDCTSLSFLSIPGSIDKLSYSIFEGCDSLHEIHVRGTPSKELKKKFGLFGEYKKIKLVKE